MELPKNWLIWAIGILFVMSIMPGEGTKAANQEAVTESEYICNLDTECPTCVGGYSSIPAGTLESNLTFFEELAYAKCDTTINRCRLSEYCLVWGCPEGSYRVNETGGANIPCVSVKQTLLDNTINKMSANPKLFLGAVVLIAIWLMLGK